MSFVVNFLVICRTLKLKLIWMKGFLFSHDCILHSLSAFWCFSAIFCQLCVHLMCVCVSRPHCMPRVAWSVCVPVCWSRL